MKKLLTILVIICVLGALVYSQRGNLVARIMPRAVETAMSQDPTAGLPDGMHLLLCGAGGPLPDPQRSGPCIAVQVGERVFIVDAGTNGVRNLMAIRYPVGRIEGVLLTHFHSDHIDGLGEMATMRWVNGNHSKPLPVIGPEGVEKIVAGFNVAYSQDAVYRNAHHGDAVAPLSGQGMGAHPFALPPAGELTQVYERDGLQIHALAVDHAPVSPAVGYLFTYKERSILISGDTAKSANIETFARGVDLLVHEALAPNIVTVMSEVADRLGNASVAKVTMDILDYHASPVEAAQTARDADVGHLLYYHIVPPLVVPGLEAVWLEGVDEVFTDYTVGRDGTAFSLPANSDEIILTSKGGT